MTNFTELFYCRYVLFGVKSTVNDMMGCSNRDHLTMCMALQILRSPIWYLMTTPS